MTHDVPRDLNALANAVDEAAGTKLATLDADGQISSSQVRPIPGLSTHMNDSIKHESYAVTAGTANSYTVTVSPTPSLTDGLAVAVKIHADSTGPATLNVNGLGAKPLKKANGNDVVGLKAQGIYSFRYNATTAAFILQGEGGNGNALPSDVLKGKTFSNDYGDQVGTMDLSNLTPENVKNGVRIHNVTGTLYEDTVKSLIVGENIVLNNYTTTEYYRSASDTGYLAIKEFRMNRPGSIRISFSARKTTLNQSVNFYVRVNGSNVSGPFLKTGTARESFTTDVTGLKDGDVVSLSITTSGAGTTLLDTFAVGIGNELPYVTQTLT